REGLVHEAVAVVVEAVAAGLAARLVGARVVALPPARAFAGRGGAGADAVRAAEVGRRGEAFVDGAVAVVVPTVAHLGAVEAAGVLAAVAQDAFEVVEAARARDDGARAGVADFARVRERAGLAAHAPVQEVAREVEVLVGVAVAVVVEPVALLE